MQTAVGLGLLAGPFIGQAIFTVARYQATFYVLGVVLFLAMLLNLFVIPNSVN